MIMRTYILPAAAAAAAAFAATPSSAAVTVVDGSCINVSDAAGCLFNGNITEGTTLETQNAYNTYNNTNPSANPDITLTWLFKSDDGMGFPGVVTPPDGLSGTWNTPGFLVEYIAVKAGPQFVLYKLAAPASSGTYSTAGLGDPQRALSHLSFFGTAVPEPATWAMMISGFGLMGAAMRRRTRVNVAFA
jgi:hypothetical protein